MNKIVHIITRMDRGGSAQNTLLTCQELSRKYDVVLAHGLSRESKMTDWERQSLDTQIEEARKHGLRDITIPSLVRRVDPVRDIRAFLALWALLRREKPTIVHTRTQMVNFSDGDYLLRSRERHITYLKGHTLRKWHYITSQRHS